MKIEVMSGQPGVRLNEIFANMLANVGIDVHDADQEGFVIFPEHRIEHQQVILNDMRALVADYIKRDKDLYVLTYSDHIFNAIRLEIKKHRLDFCVLHNIMRNGCDVISAIDDNGQLSHWVDDVFDTWDNALIELLTDVK